MVVELIVREGHDAGTRLFVLGPRGALIGRSSGCALHLFDERVSRRHCQIDVDPQGARIRDLESGGRTFVNGVRVLEASLEDGDRVRLGDTLIECAIAPEIVVDGESRGRINGYRLIEEIGRGAHGSVFRAIDFRTELVVAVKIVPIAPATDRRAIERCVRGARVEAALRHRSIVAVRDIIALPRAIHIVMDHVQGEDLGRRVARRGSVPAGEATRVAIAALEGLQFAAERGFVHRDVKPANLLRSRYGYVKLADFGLARTFLDSGLSGITGPGDLLGTPAYMAPEQIERARLVDQRADVYSLGATLFFLLTGAPPFVGNVGSVLDRVRREPAPSLSGRAGVPEALARAVARSLEKSPAARFQMPGDFADALRVIH